MCLCSEQNRIEADGENGNRWSHKGMVSEKKVEMGSVSSFVTAVIRSGPITATEYFTYWRLLSERREASHCCM